MFDKYNVCTCAFHGGLECENMLLKFREQPFDSGVWCGEMVKIFFKTFSYKIFFLGFIDMLVYKK